MAPPRSSKRHQTKLSFSPKSSTSKYANVTYEGSPAKKRKTNGGQQQLDAMFRSDGPSSSTVNAAAGPTSPLRSSQNIPIGTIYDSDKELGEDGRAVSDETDSDDSMPRSKRRSRNEEPLSTSIFTRAPIISPKTKEKSNADNRKHATDRKGKGKLSVQELGHSDIDVDDVAPVTPSRSRLTRALSISDDPDEEDIVSATQRQRKTINISSDSESDVQPATQRRKTRLSPNNLEDDGDKDQTDESDAPVKTLSRQRRRKTRRSNPESEEEEDEDEPITPTRRQHQKRRSSSEDAEAAELAADAKELRRSTVFKKEKVGRLRDRAGNNKVNDRRSRLEELKAQREGRTIEISDDDDEEEDDEDIDDQQALDQEEEEDDWVIDDDEEARDLDEVGTNTDMLPLEMMRHGQRSLKEHFLYVVKWMVASRFNPAEAEELKELYELSTRRVNREAQGLTDRLISSAWVANFVYILKARPDYEEMEIGASGFESDKCAACNRSGHPAKFLVKLKGKAYNRKKLEPLKDEDDEDEAEETSEDEGGHKLVSEDREWYLGT